MGINNGVNMETVKLTAMELAALTAIDHSEYGDALDEPIWSFSVTDNIDKAIPKKSVPGIVSSLSKKGLVHCSGGGAPISTGAPDDATIMMSEAGIRAYVAAVGADKVRKSFDPKLVTP